MWAASLSIVQVVVFDSVLQQEMAHREEQKHREALQEEERKKELEAEKIRIKLEVCEYVSERLCVDKIL